MERLSSSSPESVEKSFSVASLMQSVRSRMSKAMDDFKGFGKVAALATVLTAAPGCTDPANNKEDPLPAFPTGPTAMALANVQQPDKELAKALAGIFPSDEKPRSTLVSLDSQELPWGFSQWREEHKPPHVVPTSASFDLDNVKNGNSSFMLTQNNSWTLFPSKEIRNDIGEDQVSSLAIVQTGTRDEQPEKKPHSDNRNVAGKGENEWLAPQEMAEEEWRLALLDALQEFYPHATLREVKNFLKTTKGKVHIEVHLAESNRPQNGLSGKETLQKLTGQREITPENIDQIFGTVLTYGLGSSIPRRQDMEEEVRKIVVRNTKEIIDQVNRVDSKYPGYKNRMIWHLNTVLSATGHTTPEELQKLFNGAPNLMAHMFKIGRQSDVMPESLKAMEYARASVSNDPALYVRVNEKQTFIPLSIEEAKKIAGKDFAALIALQNEALAAGLDTAQKEVEESMAAEKPSGGDRLIAHAETVHGGKHSVITGASIEADIAVVAKQSVKDAS